MSKTNRLLSFALHFWLCSLLWASGAHAGLFDKLNSSEPEFLPVEEAFPYQTAIEEIAGPGHLLASWNTEPGYYLYKHRTYLSQNGENYFPVQYSQQGKEKVDEAFGLVTAFYGPLDIRFDLSALQPGEATLNFQGCADAGLCYPPQKVTVEIPVFSSPKAPQSTSSSSNNTLIKTDESNTAAPAVVAAKPPFQNPAAQKKTLSDKDFFSERSTAEIIALFFLFGLGLTFTPCVLPMVPILTSVVLGGEQPKSGASRRGFILSSVYVAGMAITYAIAGVIAGMLGAGANIQAWMQTPWVLSLFAAMFVVLSLSMFGLYELQLPSFLRNRLNAVSQKQTGGQIASVGLMGILSALVVSPCVSAPLVGALSYISLTGDATLGGLALLALGLGMGTPLIILGTTGAKILPKAGAWMEKTKVFFGVMLLAVAIWLLGRILPGPAYLFLWAALALGYGVQLGALEPASSGAQRLLRAIGLMLVIYGVAAAWGAFKGNSDPLLPLQTHGTESRARLFQQTDSITQVKQWIESSDQPIMLDLYADWCISCKVMEDEIFSDADVQSRLSGYRWIQLDLTEQTDEQVGFLQDFALFGPPTVLFFANGQEIQSSRITGEASKDEFLAYIEQRLP